MQWFKNCFIHRVMKENSITKFIELMTYDISNKHSIFNKHTVCAIVKIIIPEDVSSQKTINHQQWIREEIERTNFKSETKTSMVYNKVTIRCISETLVRKFNAEI